MSSRTGRRPGDSKTRETILDTARRCFADHGYDKTTMRRIATVASVDPALIHHFYGTKEQLFVAAMSLPVAPGDALSELSDSPPDQLGEALARAVLGIWEMPETRAVAIGLLRSAIASEQAATMMREFVGSTILARVAEVVDGPDAELRAALAGSHMIGLALARYVVGIEPVASASVDDLVRAVGPALQHYLTATPPPADAGHPPFMNTRR